MSFINGGNEISYFDTDVDVVGVGAGTNITVTGTVTNPVVGVVASPVFTQVVVTAAAPTLNNQLTRKDYVDGLNSTNTTSISAVSSNLLAVSSNVVVNTSNISTNTLNIGSLSTSTSANSASISAVSSNLSAVSSNLVAVSTNTSTNTASISGLSTSTSANSSSISAVSSNLSAVSSNLVAVSSATSANTLNISGLSTSTSANSASISAISSNLLVVSANTSTNTLNISGLSTSASANSASISAVSSNLLTVSANTSTNSTNISAVSSNLVAVSSATSTNTLNISGLSTSTSANSASISAVSSNLSAVSSIVTLHTASISTNTSAISVLSSSLSSVAVVAGTAIQTINTNNSFQTDVSTAGTTRTIIPCIGTKNPVLLIASFAPSDGSMIGFDSATATTVTQISTGSSPVNRNTSFAALNYIPSAYDYIRKYLPAYLRILNTTTGSYASYSVTAFVGAGAFNYAWTVANIPAETTMVTITPGDSLYMIFEPAPTPTTTLAASAITNDSTGRTSLTQANLDLVNDFIDARLQTTSALYLNGDVVITAAGLLTLGGVTQSTFPVTVSSSTSVVFGSVIINGTLVMNVGTSVLTVHGDLTVIGGVFINSAATLSVRGSVCFAPKLTTDSFTVQGATINTFAEFSVRSFNVASSAGVNFTGTNIINAQSIVFDSNACRVRVQSGTSTFNASDSVVFSNNTNSIASQATVELNNTSINAAIFRAINNTNTSFYCLLFQQADVITSEVVEISGNSSSGTSGGLTIYLGGTNLSGKYVDMSNNTNLQNNSGSSCVFIGTFPATVSTITATTFDFNNNYTTNSGAFALTNQASNLIKCAFANFNLSTHNGTTRNCNISLNASTNLQGQYNTGRTPKLLINNPNSATLTNINSSSYLGVIPWGSIRFENLADATLINLTTANTYYLLAPPSQTLNTNNAPLGLSVQFDSPSAGRIRYTGLDSADVKFTIYLTQNVSTVADQYRHSFFKNGSQVTTSGNFTTRYNTNNVDDMLTHSIILSCVTNDYVEVFMTDTSSNNRNVNIHVYLLRAEKMTIM